MKALRIVAANLSLPVLLVAVVMLPLMASSARAQRGTYTKAVVGDHIRKVEDGVDQFRKYLETRGETAQNKAGAVQNSGTARRGQANPANTEARRDQANRTKDELDDAMGDLNSSTNRLRRRFDGTADYMQTREQMEKVMESGRRVNQVMTRGNYGTQAERLWTPLRKYINDLARTYGLAPMGV
jgi:hypothetical protein